MPHALRSLCWSAVTVTVLATSVHAQTAGFRSSNSTVSTSAVQSRPGSPRLTLFGGLASGDGNWDMGPALAASFNWRLSDAPFNLRVDPYFSYHGFDGGPDGSLWFLGATGNLELAFRPSGTSAEPYIFGGGGFYMQSWSIDAGGGDAEIDDSDLTGAFGFGGGVRFGGFTLEAKLQDIDEFTNVSFLVGFRLGG